MKKMPVVLLVPYLSLDAEVLLFKVYDISCYSLALSRHRNMSSRFSCM